MTTNRVIGGIPIGLFPDGIAVTPDGTRVYVTARFTSTLSGIDTETSTVVAGAIVLRPSGVTVTPDGTRAYVASFWESGTVFMVDTLTHTVTPTVQFPGRDMPLHVAATPNGAFVYVAVTNTFGSGYVAAINTATNTRARWPCPDLPSELCDSIGAGFPTGLAITPDGAFAYVSSSGANVVQVISTASHRVVSTVSVGGIPGWITMTPDGAFAYVTIWGAGSVAVIDTKTHRVVDTIPLEGQQPSGVAFTPDGAFAYVTTGPDRLVSVIDTTTYSVVDTIQVPHSVPHRVIIAPSCNECTTHITPAAAYASTGDITLGPNGYKDFCFTPVVGVDYEFDTCIPGSADFRPVIELRHVGGDPVIRRWENEPAACHGRVRAIWRANRSDPLRLRVRNGSQTTGSFNLWYRNQLPEMIVDQSRLQDWCVATCAFQPGHCAVRERCVSSAGNRTVLRFSSTIRNIGRADLVLGRPDDHPDLFEFSDCPAHCHYHFTAFAKYELRDAGPAPRKQGFCIMDVEGRECRPQFGCCNQGISQGCGDTYGRSLPCQFIDITDVRPGTYQLVDTVNPDHLLPESDYTNNSAAVTVTLPPPPDRLCPGPCQDETECPPPSCI